MRRSLVTLISVALLIVGTATPAVAGPGTWHVAATLALGTEDTAISCPTSAVCWAIEAGQLISSPDGGVSWVTQTGLVPSDVDALNDLTCPAARTCYLTATLQSAAPEVLVLHNGALTPHSVPATALLPTIACSTPSRCMATDGHTVYVTTDGAASWQPPHTLHVAVYSNPALSCIPHTARCWMVGDNGETPVIERTTNFGTDWTTQTAPGDADGMYDVTCPATSQPVAATNCYAVGSNFPDYAIVLRTTDGGAHWNFAQTPTQGYPLRSVSCPGETQCTAIGYSPGGTPFVFTTTDGQHWTSQPISQIQTDFPAKISCPTATHCAAVASAIAFYTDASGAWQPVDVDAAIEAPYALTCASALRCVGLATDAVGRPHALTTLDGATTWSAHDLPDGTGSPGQVECPSASICYAMAIAPVPGTSHTMTQSLLSVDGGVSWSFGRIRSKNGSVGMLSCPSTTTCIAGGWDARSRPKLLLTTDSGHIWDQLSTPDGFQFSSFACGSLTSCTFVYDDPNGSPMSWTSDNLGTSFQPHPMPSNYYFGMDCAGTTCVAVGVPIGSGDGAIVVSHDGGASWDPAVVPAASQLPDRISCGSQTACAASSYDFREHGGPQITGTTDGGATWHSYLVPARHEAPLAVACVRASCIASDISTAGNPLILAGRA